MKLRVLAYLFLIVHLPIQAQTQNILINHMRTMGFIMDEIFARSSEPNDYPLAAQKTRELRQQLIEAAAHTPKKFSSLPEKQRNSATVEYHQMMARVIYLLAGLEKSLSEESQALPEGSYVGEKIRNQLHELSVLIGKAHKKFRE